MLNPGGYLQAQQNTQTLPPGMYDPLQWPPVNNPANPKIPAERKLQEDPLKAPENQKKIAELNRLRKKEMNSDTAKLVALASALKIEANHPSANGLTMDEIQKAEEIAKLAHGVHEKMITVVAR